MRKKDTAADTWDREPIDKETFDELFDLLKYHPDYKVRPVIQVSHEDSAVVKTIETLDNAEVTLGDLRFDVMAAENAFEEDTEELAEIMEKHGLQRSVLLREERE